MSDQGSSGQPGDGAPSAPHPAHRLLERVAFEPDGDVRAAAALPPATRAHVSSCPVCSDEIARLRAESARFVTARPASAFATAIERRAQAAATRRRAAGAGLALLGAAAAVLIVAGPRLISSDVGSPRVSAPPDGERTRMKGAGPVDLRLFVSRHGEDARPLDPSAPLHAGEVLRFAATVPADGHVVVLDLDGAGRISRYHPTGPASANGGGPIRRGQAFLPESIHLDDFVGDELIVLAFSTEPLDVDKTTAALAAAFRAAGGALERVTGFALEGASVALVRVHKERL